MWCPRHPAVCGVIVAQISLSDVYISLVRKVGQEKLGSTYVDYISAGLHGDNCLWKWSVGRFEDLIGEYRKQQEHFLHLLLQPPSWQHYIRNQCWCNKFRALKTFAFRP